MREEDGDLRKTLDVHRGALEKLLGDTFDPQSRASVLGKFEELSKTVAADNARAIRRLVDPSDEDSPIRHLKRDIVDAFERQLKTAHEAVGELATHLRVEAGKSEIFEKSSAKGGVFEDEGDLGALRLGCMWARWIVQRQAGPAADGIDARRIEALIDDAARSLKRVTTIRRAHTAAKNHIDAAGSELGTLEQELKSVLDELAAQLEAAAG